MFSGRESAPVSGVTADETCFCCMYQVTGAVSSKPMFANINGLRFSESSHKEMFLPGKKSASKQFLCSWLKSHIVDTEA